MRRNLQEWAWETRSGYVENGCGKGKRRKDGPGMIRACAARLGKPTFCPLNCEAIVTNLACLGTKSIWQQERVFPNSRVESVRRIQMRRVGLQILLSSRRLGHLAALHLGLKQTLLCPQSQKV